MSSSSKIRIALVVRPAAGGIRTHLATLVANLDRKRFDATLFAPADFAADAAKWRVSHIPIAISPRLSFFRDRAVIHDLAQHLAGKFDLVHGHGVRGAWIGSHAAFRAGLPSFFTAHNLVPPLNPLARFGLRFIGISCAKVIAVSEAVSASLAANGLDEQKIVVIPNGVDIAPFDLPFDAARFRAEQNIPLDAPLIVAVGRLAPEKGFDVLLRAFPSVQSAIPDAQLILAGDGPEQAKLKRLSAGNPAVRFTGFTPKVVPILQIADVIAIPSRQEGQGIVALEAMAARKPIAASRVGGLIETIVDNETGLLVPPEDAAALAAGLISLLKDSDKRAAMGAAGRLRVEQYYTAKIMAAQIAALYEQT